MLLRHFSRSLHLAWSKMDIYDTLDACAFQGHISRHMTHVLRPISSQEHDGSIILGLQRQFRPTNEVRVGRYCLHV